MVEMETSHMAAQQKPLAVASILESCAGAKRQDFSPGAILLLEGDTSGRLYVLADGTVEVLRGDTQVAVIRGAGSIFGEMSVLLNRPHTATVRASSPVSAYVFDDAESFLKSHPEIVFFVGRLLAERLNAATTYLVDIKRQFEGHGSHLGMVGEVLETLIHQQHEEFMSGPEGGTDPRL
jgi:CRP/FNR family transcriptional regulator, cyclic AMP receptor protein